MMERAAGFRLTRIMWLSVALLWAVALPAQSTSYLAITPQSATLLTGDSRSFRLVDQNGRMQRNVSWDVSDTAALQVSGGDEVTIMANRPGDFRINARSANGSAEATVTVMEGKMPVGTKIWTSGTAPGCKSFQMVQAMPSANGPDLYDLSHCPDGDYITALTADGIHLWRRKAGGVGPGPAGTDNVPASANNNDAVAKDAARGDRINLSSTSICDSVTVGTDQQKIRDMLHERNLSFSEGAAGERVWTVDESNRQCKLWFDEKSILTKKRKVFVGQEG